MSEYAEEVHRLKRVRARLSRIFLMLLALDAAALLAWLIAEHALPR